MSTLHTLTLAQAAKAVRERRASAVELLDAVIARANAIQPATNAFIRIDEQLARSQAAIADTEAARGQFRGALHGVPMAHKDMYYRAGVVSSCGSLIKRDVVATTTATALARLDAAGAIQFGVLNMAEFAYGPTGHNYHFGHARNPWNLEYITGGSSSGSGAAVAARATFAALGSDTGGSIRAPAAFCGVTGLKVTYGRVSRAGAMPLSFSMDTVGPLARTAEDCAMLLAVLAGADPRDSTASSAPVADYVGRLAQPVAGLRVGVPRQYFSDDLDASIARALDEARRVLVGLGCVIVPIDIPDLAAADVAGTHIIAAEAAALHGHWMRTRPQDYSQQVRARLERGLALPATGYIDALRYRGVMIDEFLRTVFSNVDVLHVPALPIATPTIAQTDVTAGGAMDRTLALVTKFTRPFNFLGLPSLALPCGMQPTGLPIGMQLVGRPFAEDVILQLGHAYQQATDWHSRAPVL